MAKYRVVIFDASTMTPLAELPLAGLQFSRVLSGVGSLSGSLSQWHPNATETILGQLRATPDRFLAVYRNEGTTTVCVWAGPLTGTDCTFSDGNINLVGREITWYFGKRVIEEDIEVASMDVYDAYRALFDQMTGKLSTGDDHATLPAGTDINAAIPGFSVMSGSAGASLPASTPTNYVGFRGSGRHLYSDAFDALAADPETGFEWMVDYGTGSTRTDIICEVQLGYPNLGSTFAGELTEKVLMDFSRSCDWEEAATRVHILGQGYTKTLQSAVAATNNVILLEKVDDYGDISNTDMIDARAKDLRRLSKPATRSFTFAYKPCQSLPYGFCELGDTTPFDVKQPNILSITSDIRRVIQIDVSADDASEDVLVTVNDPLTDLE